MLVAGGGGHALPHFIIDAELRAGTLVPILTDWSLPQAYLHPVVAAVAPARRGCGPCPTISPIR